MEEEKQTVQVRPPAPAEEVKPPIEAVAAAFQLNQDHQRQMLYKRIQLNMKAHGAGEHAKYCGWARVSPFYQDGVSDDFFYKGYDGVSFDQAIRGEVN